MIINGQTLFLMKPIKDMLNQKHKENGVSHGLSEAGYDIRIKQDIRFHPDPQFTSPGIYEWENDKCVRSSAGRFTLASAMEEFQMPDNLVGEVKDKSTWARQGVSVFNTVIEPGWKGFLTLEIVFHGNKPVHIPAGSGIAQVIFYETSNLASYNGKYQNQEDKPVASIFEKE